MMIDGLHYAILTRTVRIDNYEYARQRIAQLSAAEVDARLADNPASWLALSGRKRGSAKRR